MLRLQKFRKINNIIVQLILIKFRISDNYKNLKLNLLPIELSSYICRLTSVTLL